MILQVAGVALTCRQWNYDLSHFLLNMIPDHDSQIHHEGERSDQRWTLFVAFILIPHSVPDA